MKQSIFVIFILAFSFISFVNFNGKYEDENGGILLITDSTYKCIECNYGSNDSGFVKKLNNKIELTSYKYPKQNFIDFNLKNDTLDLKGKIIKYSLDDPEIKIYFNDKVNCITISPEFTSCCNSRYYNPKDLQLKIPVETERIKISFIDKDVKIHTIWKEIYLKKDQIVVLDDNVRGIHSEFYKVKFKVKGDSLIGIKNHNFKFVKSR